MSHMSTSPHGHSPQIRFAEPALAREVLKSSRTSSVEPAPARDFFKPLRTSSTLLYVSSLHLRAKSSSPHVHPPHTRICRTCTCTRSSQVLTPSHNYICRACTCTRSPQVLTYVLHMLVFVKPAPTCEALKSSRPSTNLIRVRKREYRRPYFIAGYLLRLLSRRRLEYAA